MIERWTDRSGRSAFRWSLWQDGRRIAMAAEPYASPEDCEGAALTRCRRALGRDPGRVTRL